MKPRCQLCKSFKPEVGNMSNDACRKLEHSTGVGPLEWCSAECFEYEGLCGRCHKPTAETDGCMFYITTVTPRPVVSRCGEFKPEMERGIWDKLHHRRESYNLTTQEMRDSLVSIVIEAATNRFGEIEELDKELRELLTDNYIGHRGSWKSLQTMVLDMIGVVESALHKKELAICEGGFEAEV